jgi:hypothetical protein
MPVDGVPLYGPDVEKAEALKREHATVNKAFLLERGWTRTAIKRFLGEPDRRLVRVDFRKDRPECRYDMRRVIEAERTGRIRFRAAGDRCWPGRGVPKAVAEAMMAAGSARARRKILREWATGEGMISRGAPAQSRNLQWENVLDLFTQRNLLK